MPRKFYHTRNFAYGAALSLFLGFVYLLLKSEPVTNAALIESFAWIFGVYVLGWAGITNGREMMEKIKAPEAEEEWDDEEWDDEEWDDEE